MLFTALVYTDTPLVEQVYAAHPGETVTSNGYTYIQEMGHQTYNTADPESILLFDTAHVANWASYTSYWDMTSIGTSYTTPGAAPQGRINYQTDAGTITGLNYRVLRHSSDGATSGDTATAGSVEEKMLTNWNRTRMAAFWSTTASTASDSTYHYWYILNMKFNSNVDLSKMTHLYFDFWVSSNYAKGRKGMINIALWDDATGSIADGIEFDIDMSKLALDDGTPNTGHTYLLELRDKSTATINGKTCNINSINGVTFRYQTPKSDLTQYNTGSSPIIYYGKMFAFNRKDNLHPGNELFFSNASTTTAYTTSNIPDKNQGGIYSFVGAHRWNKSTVIYYPVWVGQSNMRIVGLDYGDRSSSTTDYYINACDNFFWRWRREGYTSAATNKTISFPSDPLNGSGGNTVLRANRNNTKYITANAQKSITVS